MGGTVEERGRQSHGLHGAAAADDVVCECALGAISYVSGATAAAIDARLMGRVEDGGVGFKLEQLMEMAGLATATAAVSAFPKTQSGGGSALVLCGPGNNGGDGLVAARHLKHFGFDTVDVIYPLMDDASSRAHEKLTSSHYGNLVHQATACGVRFLSLEASGFGESGCDYDFVLDCLFGFSFKGAPRAPYDAIVQALGRASRRGERIVACDVPSGWDVDALSQPDDVGGLEKYVPDVLVSLTAPKLCAMGLPSDSSRHFLGGRFIPAAVADEFNLRTVNYPGFGAQVVEIHASIPHR